MKLKSTPPLYSLKPKPWLTLAMALASLYACQPATQMKNLRHGIPQSIVPGSFKLTVAAEANDAEGMKTLAEDSSKIAEEHACSFGGLEALSWEPGVVSADLAASYQMKLIGCELDTAQVAEILHKLQSLPSIKEVEAEAAIQLAFTENDPLKARQYHLGNIRREEACDLLGGKPGQQVVVAIVDSGIDGEHPDLKNQLLRDANGQVIGANFVGKGASGRPDTSWYDQNGHGTHVAGLVGATGNNNAGGVGVASCAQVKLMPVRVMNANGQGSSIEIDRGIQWAAAQGADIINLSLGGIVYFAQAKSSHPSPLYSDLAAKGVVVFAAAGNESLRLGTISRSSYDQGYAYSYPASYDNVISVAATDSRDQIAGFSNRGETVDIAAPGDQDLSTYPGGGYRALSGTSMASPVAAGAYALALSAARSSSKDRSNTKDVVSMLMKSTRSTLPKSDVIAGGIIDTAQLVDLMIKSRGPGAESPLPSPTTSPKPAPTQPTSPVQPLPKGMSFVALTPNQLITKAQSFAVTGWPEGKTARIYLYWVTSRDPAPYAFAVLDRSNLDSTGKFVRTPDSFYLYGRGTLVAEAIDPNGQQLELIQVNLTGR